MSSSSVVILHEDLELLVVDKPAGIAVVPGREEPREASLLARLEAARGERLWVIHRLDRDVSGVLALARSAEGHRRLSRAFEQGRVEKLYWALVEGRIERDEQVIDLPLRTGGHGGRTVVDLRRGKPSRTRIRVRERLPRHSVLEVEPLTGRTHQIRAHLKAIGHPLAVDARYNRKSPGGPERPRATLHAERLRLPRADPGVLEVVARLPPELAERVEELRAAG